MRRQYSLPNCTLTIEGLGDESRFDSQIQDQRPLITTLMEFECEFSGFHDTFSLKGGNTFFDALLKEVNRYTQSLLSGINHPIEHYDSHLIIEIEPLTQTNLHSLTVTTPESGKEPVIINLSTIQLFDLVETLDQLLADPQTLPNLIFELQPLSRRYRIAEQSLTRQAAPATLGLASLAVSGLLLFFLLPIPKTQIKDPTNPQSQDKTEQLSEKEKNKELIKPEDAQAILAQAPEIEDATELKFIQRYLFRTINDIWENRDQVTQPLAFEVTATKDGSIIDYKALEGTREEDAQKTPLEALRYLPTRGAQVNKEAIAVFKVVFDGQILEINPLHGSKGEATFGPEIKQKNKLKEMTVKLRDILTEQFKEGQRFSATMEFRIAMTEDGIIGDYEALNQKAMDYEKETPLADLINLEAVGIVAGGSLVPQKPLGQFKVIFYPQGKIEVSPWRGY